MPNLYVSVDDVFSISLRISQYTQDLSVLRQVVYAAVEEYTDLKRSDIRLQRAVFLKKGESIVVSASRKQNFECTTALSISPVVSEASRPSLLEPPTSPMLSEPTTSASASASASAKGSVFDSVLENVMPSEQSDSTTMSFLTDDPFLVRFASLRQLVHYSICNPNSIQQRVLFRFLRSFGSVPEVLSIVAEKIDYLLLAQMNPISDTKSRSVFRSLWLRQQYIPNIIVQINRFLVEWMLYTDGLDFLEGNSWRDVVLPFMKVYLPTFFRGHLRTPRVRLIPRHEQIARDAFEDVVFTNCADNVDFDNLSIEKIVSSIIFVDHKLLRCVDWSELLDECWTKPAKQFRCPNLMNCIKQFNMLSNFVSVNVLWSSDATLRGSRYAKWIKVADGLLRQNDVSGSMSVLAGLDAAPVYRLTDLNRFAEPAVWRLKEELHAKLSPENNYQKLRVLMRNARDRSQPCVPYCGVFLRDLVFASDSQQTMVSARINFAKFVSLDRIISDLLSFQNVSFSSASPSLEFVRWLLAHVLIDDARLFDRSLIIQPKKTSSRTPSQR
eukprot:ANDGO_05539.mRNA.1 Ras guanine nucleotide exchange factor I